MQKRKQLTHDIFNQLVIDNIIYGEFAESGAMGNAGGLMFYLIEDDTLICFETSLFTNENLYVKASRLFLNHQKGHHLYQAKGDKIIFEYHEGGFGNHVFINNNVLLTRKDEFFLLKKGDDYFKIECSVAGVFDSIIKSIKKNDLKALSELDDLIKANRKKLGIPNRPSVTTFDKGLKDFKMLLEKDKLVGLDLDTIKVKFGDKFYQLREIINRHDPIKLIEIGVPIDEYDPEVKTIIVQIKDDDSVDKLHALVYNEFKRWFGDDVDPKETYLAMAIDIYNWINKT